MTGQDIDKDDSEAVAMRANRVQYHKARGKRLMREAEQTLNNKLILNGFFLKFETAAFQFYQASISFRASSIWRDAGYSLVRCAALHEHRLKLPNEAAILYSEAGDIYEKVDKGEALRNNLQAISLYCDLGRFDVAGRIQKKIAHYHLRVKHYEEAAEAFRKAADLLSHHPDQSDFCLERAAECFIELEEYKAASDLYVIIAESFSQSNMKSFSARDLLLRAVLCLISEPMVAEEDDLDVDNEVVNDGGSSQKYANIRAFIISLEAIDSSWRCCKEAKFLNKIVDLREDYDEHNFVDHVYFFHTARGLSQIDIKLLVLMSTEIQDELHKRREKIRLDRIEALKWQKRKERLAKKRKALQDRGLNPESIQLSDINVDENSDDEENDEDRDANEGDGSVTKAGSDSDDEESEFSEDNSDDDAIELPDELKIKEEEVAQVQRRRREKGPKPVDNTPAYLRD